MLDLSTYSGIETAMFVKWTIPGHGTEAISDYSTSITFDSTTYTSIGNLLSISQTVNELQASPSNLTITLSGIPSTEVSTLLNNDIKGSAVEIYRGIFDTSGTLLTLSENPFKRFEGIVTNYNITDTVNNTTRTAETIITLNCNSIVELLSKKISGRRTNPNDFSGENSMDRVYALSKSNYNFGAPK